MTWTLIDLYDDVHEAEEDDRWLLTYQVPVEVTHSGIFSYSYPKNMAINYAAVYGYDISDPADVDELFDHVSYQGYMWETLRQDGRLLELQHNPFEMETSVARSLVRGVVSELKASRPIRHAARPQLKSLKGTSALLRSGDQTLHDVLKRDLVARLDPEAVATHRELAAQSRVVVQDRMWSMALRIHRTREG
ncbi:hypothetical protein [Sphaerisporangium sp. NPDC051011]|uniref:hypothetical protein n=1 Tax=Sphaerisporangium sp. NPDC051011 TaxID=3155792 RepID=UPI0033C03E5C